MIWYRRHSPIPLKDAAPEEIARIRYLGQADFTLAFPDTVFVKTHNYLGEKHGYPLHNMEVTAGAIYILRNPLDVVLSMMHHFGLDIDGAIERLGHDGAVTDTTDMQIAEYHASWSTHVSSWTSREHPRFLVLRYEDLLERPQRQFRRVTDFLGLSPSRDRLKRVIYNSSFNVLRAQEKQFAFKERSEHARAFFRVGKKNQWRGVIKDEQVDRIIKRHREQMDRFKYIPARWTAESVKRRAK